MVRLRVGDADGHFSFEHVSQQVATNFAPPAVGQPWRVTLTATVVPKKATDENPWEPDMAGADRTSPDG